jgi:hypothetical protein
VTQQATEGFSDRRTSSLARHRSVKRRPPIAMRRVIVAMSQGKNRRSRVANDRRDGKPMSRTQSLLLQIIKSHAPDGELRLTGPLLGCFG